MTFDPDVELAVPEKDAPKIHTVEVFEEDEETREYRNRKSSLDIELQLIRTASTTTTLNDSDTNRQSQTSNNFQHKVLFGTAEGMKNWIQESPQYRDFFPAEFWHLVEKDLNGCFGCRYYEDAKQDLVDTWSCFKIKQVDPQTPDIKYYWMQVTLFIRWDSKNCIIQLALFLDCPEEFEFKDRLQARLRSIDQKDPYAWHATLADEIKHLYDHSIWSLRDLVRGVEKGRSSNSGFFQHDFPRLHDIARHIIHCNETLDVAKDTVECIMYGHDMLNGDASESMTTPGDTTPNSNERPSICSKESRSFKRVQWQLYSASKDLNGLKARSDSLNERLQNEINLAFNIVSQRNGENAQSDNAMMKTVAIVSLVYLPGTFVSSLFGMNFFNFNSDSNNPYIDGISMSKNFWLYWIITIPLTIATLGIWLMWHYSEVVTGAVKRALRVGRAGRGQKQKSRSNT